MRFEGPDENAIWDRLSPTVNDALAALGAKDREAVLLRFAGGLSFPELDTALGTSEDAARMRLNRAVDHLRQFFAKQGVTITAVILAGLLADRTTQAAPAQQAFHTMICIPRALYSLMLRSPAAGCSPAVNGRSGGPAANRSATGRLRQGFSLARRVGCSPRSVPTRGSGSAVGAPPPRRVVYGPVTVRA